MPLPIPFAPVVVDQKDAPVQEEVYEKPAEANEFVVPIRHTDVEPELTVGSGNRLISGEYFGGGTDLGYNRMNFPLGQRRNFPNLPRLPYVAGGQQILQRQQACPDHHELWLAAGRLAARRRGLRLCHPAAGLR